MNENEDYINEIASYVVKKRLEVPTVLFLELNKPLALLNGSILCVAIPFLGAVFSADKLKILSNIISDRRYIEELILKIEALSKN